MERRFSELCVEEHKVKGVGLSERKLLRLDLFFSQP